MSRCSSDLQALQLCWVQVLQRVLPSTGFLPRRWEHPAWLLGSSRGAGAKTATRYLSALAVQQTEKLRSWQSPRAQLKALVLQACTAQTAVAVSQRAWEIVVPFPRTGAFVLRDQSWEKRNLEVARNRRRKLQSLVSHLVGRSHNVHEAFVFCQGRDWVIVALLLKTVKSIPSDCCLITSSLSCLSVIAFSSGFSRENTSQCQYCCGQGAAARRQHHSSFSTKEKASALRPGMAGLAQEALKRRRQSHIYAET